MALLDQTRTKNQRVTELDRETKARNEALLVKAQMKLEEQDDEIKKMNELILYAKCVAVRDSQVEEKV
jgi:hypothetical protein